MSVDVEDYFQVQAFAHHAPRSGWDRWPSRVEGNTHRLLDLFDEVHAVATFFVLGWVARRHPSLVRQIAERGHEVASHGMEHRMLTEQSPESFTEDARDSKALLEDLSGGAVLGFRAPSYSIGQSTLWALDVLADAGYAYDSSVYPIRRRRYGYPEGPHRPAMVHGLRRALPEFPLPTLGPDCTWHYPDGSKWEGGPRRTSQGRWLWPNGKETLTQDLECPADADAGQGGDAGLGDFVDCRRLPCFLYQQVRAGQNTEGHVPV